MKMGIFDSATGTHDFQIVNRSDFDIHEIYVAPSSGDDWEEDLLGEDGVLEAGETFTVEFDEEPDEDEYDVRMVDEDGDEMVFENIDLTEVRQLIVQYDEDDEDYYVKLRN